jgi:hypothetical protein
VAETVTNNYDSEDVVVWLINSGDSYDTAWTFIDGAGIEAPCLLDSAATMINGYGFPDDAYAPFPRHVVVNREGVITYLATQYDANALLAAIDDAL